MPNLSGKSQSLKNLILDNQLIIDVIRKEKKRIEENYDDCDKVKEEFLLTMLSKGYIDENYSDFLSVSYEDQFTNDEYTYIQNLRDESEPDFNLKIEHLHSVERKILPYKWTNSSVLNNDILTDILNNNQTEKIEQFITAIINYCNQYKKNNFLEQYIQFINNEEKKDLFIDELLEKISKKIDSNSLSVFNEKTDFLFCRMIDKNIDDSTINSFSKTIGVYLENNTRILKKLLKNANQDSSLKEKIKKINPIIKNLSVFNDEPEAQKLLIDEAMFQISKENLDLILAQINGSQYNFGYEYFIQNNDIWKKITHPNTFNFFIEKILLTDDKLNYSQYGIVEILFSEKIKLENVSKIIEKIENESIELEALPVYFQFDSVNPPKSWTNIVNNLLNQNKLDLNFNNILYVFKLYPKGLIQFAQKVFHKMEPSIKSKSIKLGKLDDFATGHYLHNFFDTILVFSNIDDDLFEKIVDIMIYQHIKIIEFTTDSLDHLGQIPTTKAQILVKLIFKNSIFNNDSINDFLKIINQGFGDFYQNFNKIKDKCINWDCKQTWISLLSILLKDDIQKNDFIDSIMKSLPLDDFGDVIKVWLEKDGQQDATNYVRNLVNLNILDVWIKNFGRSKVLEFFDNYKESLDSHFIKEITNKIEQNFPSSADQESVEIEKNHVNYLLEIIKKYKIPPRAIFERRIKLKKLFEPLTSILQINSNNKLDWTTIISTTSNIINSKSFLQKALNIVKKNPNSEAIKKTALLLLPQNSSFRAVLKNDLFIIGRVFYNILENNKLSVNDFTSYEKNDLLTISSIWSLHPLLCGAIFEGFFDNDGYFKKTFNNTLFKLSIELGKDRNSKGYEFIRDCLKPFRFDLSTEIVSIFNL